MMKLPPQNKTILITGGSGFFGMNAAPAFEQRGYNVVLASSQPEKHQAYSSAWAFAAMNILDKRSIVDCLELHKPDIVIHAAAYSQPVMCEQAPEMAYKLNVVGTRNVAEAVSTRDILFIHISTDLVFDGEKEMKNGFYTEVDMPNAKIVYGKTKIQAEEIFHIVHDDFHKEDTQNVEKWKECGKWMIIRSALMFGNSVPWTNGFPQFAIDLLKSGKQTTLFTDQYRTPVYIPDLAGAIELLVEKQCFGEIFHAGGAERVNRVEFVKRFCTVAGVDTANIRAVSMDAVPEYTTKVRDVALNSDKLRCLGWEQTPLETAFRVMISTA